MWMKKAVHPSLVSSLGLHKAMQSLLLQWSSNSRVGYRGGYGAEAAPLKLMIFISIKMNGKETTYYAKCIGCGFK